MSTDNPTTAGATAVTGKDAPAPNPGLLAEEAEVHRGPHPEAGEHGAHPTDRQYILIALILAAITAVGLAVVVDERDNADTGPRPHSRKSKISL